MLLIYLIVLLALAATVISMISNLIDSRTALEESRAVLVRLDKALKRSPSRQDQTNAAVNGPPFLIGKTITIAGAVLGSLYPGLTAAAHDPIEALAYE